MLAQCMAGACDPKMPFDLFKACVWSNIVGILSGGKPTRDDTKHELMSCGFMNSERGKVLAKNHAESLLKAAAR